MRNIHRWLVSTAIGGILAAALPGQTIVSPTYTYDTADGLVEWSFTLNEGAFSGSVTHLVLGFDGTDGLPPAVFWNSLGSVTIDASSHGVTKVDVWTDSAPGRSYLELSLNTPFSLDGNSTTFPISFLTGGIQNLANAGSVSFFVELRNGTAVQNAGLDGALVVQNSQAGVPGDLTAVPEPATCALAAGMAGLALAALRRRRCAA